MQRRQFALRKLMLGVTLACVVLAAWHQLVERPRQLRVRHNAAIQAICDKGVDLRYHGDETYTVFFKNQNVVDVDLQAFVPAFTLNGGWRAGSTPVRRVNFNGSQLSPESVREFQASSGVEVQLQDDR